MVCNTMKLLWDYVTKRGDYGLHGGAVADVVGEDLADHDLLGDVVDVMPGPDFRSIVSLQPN